MEFNLKSWLEEIVEKIKNEFGNRVLFIGYQGSYKRGEATPASDIDMVVILDKVNLEDLKLYRKITSSMPFSEKACGFIGGAKEVENWVKSDIFQLVHDTELLYGSLENLVPQISTDDVKEAVKTGAANLYHAACHSFLYDADLKESLAELYKHTFFTIQAKHYLKSGDYICRKDELIKALSSPEKNILQTCIERIQIKEYSAEQIEKAYEHLIKWCSDNI